MLFENLYVTFWIPFAEQFTVFWEPVRLFCWTFICRILDCVGIIEKRQFVKFWIFFLRLQAACRAPFGGGILVFQVLCVICFFMFEVLGFVWWAMIWVDLVYFGCVLGPWRAVLHAVSEFPRCRWVSLFLAHVVCFWEILIVFRMVRNITFLDIDGIHFYAT